MSKALNASNTGVIGGTVDEWELGGTIQGPMFVLSFTSYLLWIVRGLVTESTDCVCSIFRWQMIDSWQDDHFVQRSWEGDNGCVGDCRCVLLKGSSQLPCPPRPRPRCLRL